MNACQDCHCQSCPCTSAGDCQILTGRSGPVSYEVTTFVLGSWYVWDLVCTPPPPTVEFQLPPVLWNSSDQTPLAFKARFSGGFPSYCQTLRLGNLMWVTPIGEFLWYNYFPICGLPTRQVQDLIVPFLPSCCSFLFVFECRVSFLLDFSIVVCFGNSF